MVAWILVEPDHACSYEEIDRKNGCSSLPVEMEEAVDDLRLVHGRQTAISICIAFVCGLSTSAPGLPTPLIGLIRSGRRTVLSCEQGPA